MVFCEFIFIFLFRTNVRNRYFFRKWHSQRFLVITLFKVPSQQFVNEAHWQQHFERHCTVFMIPDYIDMDQFMCWLFHQNLSQNHETKINEVALKIITPTKYDSARQRTFNQNRLHFPCFYKLPFSLKQSQFSNLTQC